MRHILLLLILAIMACNDSKKNILIIGDSISIGYTPYVKESLSKQAIVFHNYGNARFTGIGIDSIKSWLGETNWDVIHFNFGLHDLCYRSTATNRDKINGQITTPIEEYDKNLRKIVNILKQTNAKLIFASTTMVPPNEPGRYSEDVERYNIIARKIMNENGIKINELYQPSIEIHGKYGNGNTDVHYQKEGYKKLSEFVTNSIREVL